MPAPPGDRPGDGGGGPGSLACVGIGPGHPLDRTRRAEAAIADADLVVGYRPYLERIADLTAGKELLASGMTDERRRAEAAIDAALAGRRVAIVSSGDPGIYGMAGLVLELLAARGLRLPLSIIPGVTAASAAAAALGAPLMCDFACLSLSDRLVPWARIRRRLEALAATDLALALYNPRARGRTAPFAEAMAILLAHRGPEAPVGIVGDAGTAEERRLITTLARVPAELVDMRTLVIVGAGDTRAVDGRLLTPRGYLPTPDPATA